MTYKAVIFDFFDVIHTDPYHAWLHAHHLKNDGSHAEANKLIDLDRITMQEFYARLGKTTGQTAAQVEAEQLAASEVDGAVVALIEQLGQSYSLALVSNAPSSHLRAILEEHGLARLFEHVIISGEVGYSKPSLEIFEHALEKLGVSAQETIFIDDNPANVAAAKSLGITGVVHRDAEGLKRSLNELGLVFA